MQKAHLSHSEMKLHPLSAVYSVKSIKQQLERFPIELLPPHSTRVEEQFEVFFGVYRMIRL